MPLTPSVKAVSGSGYMKSTVSDLKILGWLLDFLLATVLILAIVGFVLSVCIIVVMLSQKI